MNINMGYKTITHRTFLRLLMMLFLLFINGNLFAIDFEVNGITYHTSALTNTDVWVTGKAKNYTGDIVIPESVSYQGNTYTVTTIDEDAFYGDTDITSIVIPPTIEYIDESAFSNCSNLDIVYITSIDSWLNIGFDNATANPLANANHLYIGGKEVNDIAVPYGTTVIDDYAFYSFRGLKTITFPNTLEWINLRAFANCENLEVVVSKRTTPPSLDTEKGHPFSGISSNAKLVVPKGSIDAYVGWRNYYKEIVEDTGPISFKDPLVKQLCILNWDYNSDGELDVDEAAQIKDIGRLFRRSKIECFEELNYFTGLTSIPREAFEDCTNLKSFIIPQNVEYIYSQSFKGCNSIIDLIIPGSVRYIGSNAFSGCNGLTKITIRNGVKSIDYSAFAGCGSLFSVSLPESIDSIGLYPFYDCPLLSEINVATNNKIYESPSGSNCIVERATKKLIVGCKSTIVPLSVKTIGKFAFRSCTTLNSFEFPSGLETIEYEAFVNCSGLKEIIVPKSVIDIEDRAFEGCSQLNFVMSKIETPFELPTRVFNGISSNATLLIPKGTRNYYVTSGWTNYFKETFEGERFKLIINAIGAGDVLFQNSDINNACNTFMVYEGASYVLSFIPNTGHRIKNVILNNIDVTTRIINNQYTISNINSDNILEVEFEAIIHTLNIVAVGNGNVDYNGAVIRNQSQSYSVQEGSSVDISFTPDTGYRIASVKLNNTDVTASVVNNSYTISNITANTTLAVTFEEIPPTVYDLVIKATGNGEVDNGAYSVRNKSMIFKVTEGSSVTVSFSPDKGYRLKSVKLNGQDVTASVVGNHYTISEINANTTLEVVFEEIPPTTYSLSVTASGNGSVIYDGYTIKGKTSTFTIIEGSYITVQLSADDGYRLKRVTLNGLDVTADVANDQYTTPKMMADATLIVEFEVIPNITDAGVAYTVTSYDEQTVVVAAGNYGNVLTVPASFTAKEKTWTVVGIDEDALKDNSTLAAIIWNPEVVFTAKVSNPNLLLYVKDAQYAPATIQNVVVNNQAENIVLVEAASGNDFYCPQAFTAKRISYEHNYSMISGYKTCQGWETLVLPFDVTTMINAKGQELTPYINWQYGNSLRPFWLYELTTQGWKAGSGIKANTPYVISMPNNEMYDVSFNQTGNIQFIGTNVEVKASTEMKTGQHGNKRLLANYQTQEASADIYALNVSNEWSQNTATEVEGSTFIRSLRSVHPFEAYLTVEGSNAPWAIPIFENDVLTDMSLTPNPSPKGEGSDDWYDLQGRKLQREPKKAGIYIYKGEKVRR